MRNFGVVRYVSVLLAVAAVAGCEGKQGAQGPAGPPGDRSHLYCRYSGATLNASNLTTSVACDTATDMPWTGGCEAADLPEGLYLEVNAPVNWEDINTPAGWTCTWAAFNAVPNLSFGANAEICCYAMGGT